MTAPASYDDYPFFGRYESDHAHAPFLIVRSLIQLGLADWSATLLHWLGRFDGYEQYIAEGEDPSLDPVCRVRDLLAEHVVRCGSRSADVPLTAKKRRERLDAIVEDLLQLDFVAAYAWWGKPRGDRVHWDCLQQDWLWFIQLGPDLSALQQMRDDEECAGLNTGRNASQFENLEYRDAVRDMLLSPQIEERA